MTKNAAIFGGIGIVLLAVGYFLKHIQPLVELARRSLASSEPVILVARKLENMYSNETEFPVGEHLYFRLQGGPPALTMFWRLQGRIVQHGIEFDTSDLKDLDLEALELSSISTGGFLIEAFVSYGEAHHSVQKTITFYHVRKTLKRVGEPHKQYEPTGSLSYKLNEIMVMGKNGPIICTINPQKHLVSECPE